MAINIVNVFPVRIHHATELSKMLIMLDVIGIAVVIVQAIDLC